MNRNLIIFLITVVLIWGKLFGQKKVEFSGHLQNLNTVLIQDIGSEWYAVSSIYNRLNLKWYFQKNLTFSVSARNVINYGRLIYLNYPYYSDLLVKDEGLLDLTGTIARDSSYIFYTNIDRLNLKFTRGKFETVAGRQRINWGINLVWNPNDIFNTFNYYDFDYTERPGCDALKLTYFTGALSSTEVAVKIDSSLKMTVAGIYKFNHWNYDFQVLGGLMKTDAVIGMGWSGNIKKAGFNGEASLFRDIEKFPDTTCILVLSAGINYTFRSSIFLHGSFLFTSNGTTGKAGVENPILNLRDVSPKSFTAAKYSIFGQVSYPFSPVITADVSCIFNPNDYSFYIGPNVNFSLADNITFLFMTQIFAGEEGSEFGGLGSLIYLRLKWSF